MAPLDLQQVLYELPVIAYRRGGILAFAAPYFVSLVYSIKVYKESGLCEVSWGFLAL